MLRRLLRAVSIKWQNDVEGYDVVEQVGCGHDELMSSQRHPRTNSDKYGRTKHAVSSAMITNTMSNTSIDGQVIRLV